jgi:hypothetical protein
MWQPIETAPTEGEMLGWSSQHGYSLVFCDQRLDRYDTPEYFNGDVYCFVTHWQPLPEPPK